MNAEIIIARCTRNGVTAWQAVAMQLGVSVDKARCMHDPNYLKVRPWPQACEPVAAPEPIIDFDDMRSPNAHNNNVPWVRDAIVGFLSRHSESAATIAIAIGAAHGTVKKELSNMKAAGQVEHDGGYPYTWRLAGIAARGRGNTSRAGERV